VPSGGTRKAGVFRLSWWAALPLWPLTVALVAGIHHLVLVLAPGAAGTDPARHDVVGILAVAATGGAVGAAINMWRLRRHPVWLRVSAAGMELAPRGRPFFLSWDDIDLVQVRRRGPLARLEVTPKDLYAIRTELPHRDLPRVRHTAEHAILTMGVGFLRPGPRRLRAELNHVNRPGNR
jgi:hypothetical protein